LQTSQAAQECDNCPWSLSLSPSSVYALGLSFVSASNEEHYVNTHWVSNVAVVC